MSTTAIDTSVIVAALQAWHQEHEEARELLHDLLASEDEVLLPTHVLLEVFSVMTRLPPPHRLHPRDALRLLEGTFRGSARLAALGEEEHWGLLRTFAERGTSGGATYDALILHVSILAGAERILTFNRRDFERLAQGTLEVISPPSA